MTSSSQKRRERRKRAEQKHREAEAKAAITGSVLGHADGETCFVLVRKGERVEVTPTREVPRHDLFEYYQGTHAIRGLTLLALSWGWRLADG